MEVVMRFLLAQMLAVCLLLPGCGAFFVGFVSNPGGTVSVSGTVTVVFFGFIQDPTGVKTTFTAVTFVNPGSSITINFCGDQSSRFPINQFVRADFRTGVFCSTLVAVVVSTWVHELLAWTAVMLSTSPEG
jgi:hypothetical protein